MCQVPAWYRVVPGDGALVKTKLPMAEAGSGGSAGLVVCGAHTASYRSPPGTAHEGTGSLLATRGCPANARGSRTQESTCSVSSLRSLSRVHPKLQPPHEVPAPPAAEAPLESRASAHTCGLSRGRSSSWEAPPMVFQRSLTIFPQDWWGRRARRAAAERKGGEVGSGRACLAGSPPCCPAPGAAGRGQPCAGESGKRERESRPPACSPLAPPPSPRPRLPCALLSTPAPARLPRLRVFLSRTLRSSRCPPPPHHWRTPVCTGARCDGLAGGTPPPQTPPRERGQSRSLDRSQGRTGGTASSPGRPGPRGFPPGPEHPGRGLGTNFLAGQIRSNLACASLPGHRACPVSAPRSLGCL